MNINELYEQANAHAGLTSWQCNVPADEIIELIAAYREAVAALKETTFALEHRWEVIANMAAPVMEGVIDAAHTNGIQALATAKRLGVE